MRHLRLAGTIPRGTEALDRADSWTPWCRVCTRLAQEHPANVTIIYSHQKALKYVDSCCVLSAYVSRDCVRLRLTTYMLTLSSSAFFVADIVIPFDRYIVFSCGRCGCGRYYLWPIWYRPIGRTCSRRSWCFNEHAFRCCSTPGMEYKILGIQAKS